MIIASSRGLNCKYRFMWFMTFICCSGFWNKKRMTMLGSAGEAGSTQ